MMRVLLTGASSGIGLDAARFLTEQGIRVVATCRKDSDIEARRAEGMECLRMDLDDEDSIAACVETALQGGQIDGLVNNAAFALPGAVEDMPRGAMRAIFETNLLGTHDLTRRLIPHFRERGAGRIVNVSSVLGLVGIPWRGPYVATKFALEGLSDVLRLEMRGTGIHVVLIEPGPITSRIRENAIPHFERWVDWQASPRAQQYRDSLLKRLYEPSGPDRYELPPREVSTRILRALTADRPAPRYHVTTPTRISSVARRVLPTVALDWFARRA
ncbi:SDR family NAD(P)-dependent oxidoreductase [Paracoccus sp. 1_MG-2023]|uniref:SDR family NAD(P)-dependent oxidoreductase n=1 Tax=unclassified Paracoccus (in: a-proteobacteria) TaxID=2688777 RepID=UPI001C09B02F|nr:MULTISPECIES: SDR family NAD(P)-dependent oxidoreductase [unclassified Paracoccus (in: a-proteobacteria)]MBU2956509.1 SDR family NAD(P)-dependent oxidoreductase [Paracoccus sp. C2R09]MDO6669687.1 SDR family NAD(P)-dependent oxidoreductase [Paracoccus sp. 1_MG-2023]